MPHHTSSSLVQTPPTYLHWTVFVLPCPTQCQLSWYLPHFLPSHHLLSTLLCLNTPTSLPQRLNFLSSLPPILPFSSSHGCLMSRLFGSWIMDYIWIIYGLCIPSPSYPLALLISFIKFIRPYNFIFTV